MARCLLGEKDVKLGGSWGCPVYPTGSPMMQPEWMSCGEQRGGSSLTGGYLKTTLVGDWRIQRTYYNMKAYKWQSATSIFISEQYFSLHIRGRNPKTNTHDSSTIYQMASFGLNPMFIFSWSYQERSDHFLSGVSSPIGYLTILSARPSHIISHTSMFAIQNFNFNTDQARDKKTGEEVYFEGSKKNELNDIKNYLKTIVSDPEKEFYRKELIKKIVAYTTAGIDTSRLYPELVLASATRDLVEKKLIYHYLSIYSSANENFARMAINTFVKDCSSPNPNIRAFAVRNLANLRFKGRDQYAYPLLLQGLGDHSSLVKKSCVMGLTKLIVEKNRLLETPIRDEGILNRFYEMIREPDMSLVCTVLEAINEIEEEGIAMSKKLWTYLLSSLPNFGDFQLPVVLHYLQLYDPKNDEEIIHVLSTLEPKLKTSSPAVALAISKIFLKMIKLKPVIKDQALSALRKSLLAFLNNDLPEVEYVVLKHIEYLVMSFGEDAFCNLFKRFLLSCGEPSYIKVVKVCILERLISKENHADIINQFAEYLYDEDICADTVASLSRTLLKSQEGEARFIIKTVIKTVEQCPRPSLCNNVLPLVRNYLRLYPKDFPMFAQIFYCLVENAKEEVPRCCAIEIIGQFGEMIEDSVELLAWSQSEQSDRIKLSLLRANVKLFLKRPAEMYNVLCTIFRTILTDDETHLHLKDYAACLYRGLSAGVEEFKTTFLDTRREQYRLDAAVEELEFNSLEILYSAKHEKWQLDKLKYIEVEEEIAVEPEQQGEEEEEESGSHTADINMDSKFKKLESQNFDITFSMTAEEFERKWEDYDIGSSITRIVKEVDLLSEENLEELFKIWNITVLASADTDEEIKFYNYCRVQEADGDIGIACMEFSIHKLPETMTLMIKCEDQELAGFVSRYIEEFLRINEII